MSSTPSSRSKGKQKQQETPALELLDLPGEILSQIATYLPLGELTRFLSLNTALLNLTRSHLTPLRPVVRDILRAGPPYPAALETLPSQTYLVGHDEGRLFLDVLVRAPPKWILERLEIGQWRQEIWKEAYERRFLPSWRRYKGAEDTWRAVFLRMLGRLDHRAVGCAHGESWTRFITLRRNGSALINRIYTRTFEPNEIFDELKHQGNLDDYPTYVRVLVHLQDVRIITLGVLVEKPSYFTNPNAHLALHPPLLRDLTDRAPRSDARRQPLRILTEGSAHLESISPWERDAVSATAPPAAVAPQRPAPTVRLDPAAVATQTSHSNDRFFPLSRTISGGSTRSVTEARTSAVLSSLTNWVSRRRSSTEATTGNTLTLVRSLSRENREAREGDGMQQWIRRARAQSMSAESSQPVPPPQEAPQSVPTPPQALPLSPRQQPIPMPTLAEDSPGDSPKTRRHAHPYVPLTHPTPAYSHALYPNYTPCPAPMLAAHTDPVDSGIHVTDGVIPRVRDFRIDYPEAEDDAEGAVWAANEAVWGADGTRMTEWSEETSSRWRWVGPMILLAQLFPATRSEAVPPGATRDGAAEGANPDLGPRGTYASLGWEDLEALLPWLTLQGSGQLNEPRRSGMGFEPGGDL